MLMPRPTKLSADEATALERLKHAAGRPMTKNKLLEPRISWVYGNLPNNSTITREEVANRIRARERE
jgi:hypothetical protein